MNTRLEAELTLLDVVAEAVFCTGPTNVTPVSTITWSLAVSVVLVMNCNVIVLDTAVTAELVGVKIKAHVVLAGGVL